MSINSFAGSIPKLLDPRFEIRESIRIRADVLIQVIDGNRGLEARLSRWAQLAGIIVIVCNIVADLVTRRSVHNAKVSIWARDPACAERTETKGRPERFSLHYRSRPR
jgi:hypothetical protein